MSAGSRRNGTSKTGPFPLTGRVRRDRADETDPSGQRLGPYTARHANARPKTARRAGKAAPAAAIAATLVAGAATFGLTAAQSGDGQAAAALPRLPAANDAVAVADATAKATAADAAADAVRVTPAVGPATAHATPARTHPATATATPSPPRPAAAASTRAATTLTCPDTSGLLPANLTAIVTFLLANGYTSNAAAGIAGNIYQESKGDPESIGSGGGGLIGWTPLRAGLVTGNPPADLRAQLAAILTYDNGWSAYLPALNAAASPADAADIYVTDFERAGVPAASTREASAGAVAAACGL